MSALLTSAGERQVIVSLGRVGLPGTLAWPEHPSGLVLFAHGPSMDFVRAAGVGRI